VDKCCIARHAIGDNITKRISFTCFINKATNTRLEFITLIAFPLQLWLNEHALMLSDTYIACPVKLQRNGYIPFRDSMNLRAVLCGAA
jgi:hypothetical protein